MNLKKVVRGYLETNGYDGLVDVDEGCACKLDDFMPCGTEEQLGTCEPGYAENCPPECHEQHGGWHILLIKRVDMEDGG